MVRTPVPGSYHRVGSTPSFSDFGLSAFGCFGDGVDPGLADFQHAIGRFLALMRLEEPLVGEPFVKPFENPIHGRSCRFGRLLEYQEVSGALDDVSLDHALRGTTAAAGFTSQSRIHGTGEIRTLAQRPKIHTHSSH